MTQEQIFPSPQALSLTRKPKKQRVLVPLLTLAATIAILKSYQIIDFEFGISIQVNYSYSSAMRYQLITDIGVGVSCLLSLVFHYLFTRPNWNINNYFYIFLFDLVLLLLINLGCTAGNSNGKKGWIPICLEVPTFCGKVTMAIVFSYYALSCMLILTIMAASKLRS